MELKKTKLEIDKLLSEVPISDIWLQLKKDFAMAGVNELSEETPNDSDSLIAAILAFIIDPKNKTTNWDNLNYRIDLPSFVDYNNLSDLEYAPLIAYRTLQKVWFRKQFNSTSKQDCNVGKPLS